MSKDMAAYDRQNEGLKEFVHHLIRSKFTILSAGS